MISASFVLFDRLVGVRSFLMLRILLKCELLGSLGVFSDPDDLLDSGRFEDKTAIT